MRLLTVSNYCINKNLVKIVFDPAKRQATLDVRGLDMADAWQVFETERVTVVDDRRDNSETRFVTVGDVNGRIVILVWTQRGETCRIISMRKANDREKSAYS